MWFQDDVVHRRCYWLALPKGEPRAGQELVAQRAGQIITLAGKNIRAVTVLLSDATLDLDQPVVVRSGEETLFDGIG